MNNTLPKVTRTLHELIKALPGVRTHCNKEVLQRHLQLIAHFQQRYDRLAVQPGNVR